MNWFDTRDAGGAQLLQFNTQKKFKIQLAVGRGNMKSKIWTKFLIGFVAGLCAILFPRIVAELAIADDGDVISLFQSNYLLLSAVFAILVGAVVAIFELEESRPAKEVFMTALAIPGVLSGALNTTVSVKDYKSAEKIIAQVQNTLLDSEEIQIFEIPKLVPLGAVEVPVSSRSNSFFIDDAYAQESAPIKLPEFGIGIRSSQRDYRIVLDRAATKEQALANASALSQSLPNTIYKIEENQFVIIKNGPSQDKTSALLEAIKLKRERGLNPQLVRTK